MSSSFQHQEILDARFRGHVEKTEKIKKGHTSIDRDAPYHVPLLCAQFRITMYSVTETYFI